MQSNAPSVHRVPFTVPAALVALTLAAPAIAQGPSEDVGVFLPAAAPQPGVTVRAARPPANDPLVVRARRVGVDWEAFAPVTAVLDRGAAPPVLRLNLFEDVVVESLVESVDLTAAGFSWSGAVVGDPLSSVAVAVNGAAVSGVVRTRGRVFTIQSAGAGLYAIREIDRSGLPSGEPPFVVRSATVDPEPRAFVDDAGRVDIAVFYTRAARRDAGGTDQIHALIDAWIADTNGAYLRSDIQHRLNLVLREEVSYTEREATDDKSVAKQALDCLAESDDGCLDAIHDRREEYSADLVHLIVSSSTDEYPRTCGIARTPGSFGVTHLDCGSLVFAHEIGHNSGAVHDRYVEYNDECETDATISCFRDTLPSYAYGYVNPYGLDSDAPFERRWRTVMSYSDQCLDADVNCVPLMRFSNPDQSWYGDDLGVHGTHASRSYSDAADAARRGPADAARTHRDFAHNLANRMVREAPDLTVKGIKTSRLQAEPRSLVRLSAVVHNLGIATGYEPETAVAWCRASRSGCASSVGVESSVPILEANGQSPVSTSFKLPASRGSYSYRACVSSVLGETLTENNCSEAVTVTVGVPDLELTMSLSRSSAQAGDEVEMESTVRNRGSIASAAGALTFHVRDLEGEWDQIGSRWFGSINAGSRATALVTVEAPDAAGEYLYAACLTSSHVEFACAFEPLTVSSATTLGIPNGQVRRPVISHER